MNTELLRHMAQVNETTYLDGLEKLVQKYYHIDEEGEGAQFRQDRTKTGTVSHFAVHQTFICHHGLIPLVSTKKIFVKSMLAELLWFLEGSTNAFRLNELGSKIWDEWADEDGELGPVYGKQWTSWDDYVRIDTDDLRAQDTALRAQGYDLIAEDPADCVYHRSINQIENLIQGLIDNPFSRRHVVWAWNPGDTDKVELPPCHMGFVCYVEQNPGQPHTLHMHMTQRSQDVFLGAPFNIASYGALLQLLCQLTGYKPGDLSVLAVDQHLYLNHIEQAVEQVNRKPLVDNAPQIFWDVEKGSGVEGLRAMLKRVKEENAHPYTVEGYAHMSPIKAPVAVRAED